MAKPRVESKDRAQQVAARLLAMRAGAPPPRARPARPAVDYPRLQRRVHWLDGVLRLYRAAAGEVAALVDADHAGGSAGGPDGELDPLIDVVRRAHRILLEHPVAAKAAYAALARQGRAFAATAEGAALRARLVRSRRLGRASLLWRSLTMGMLDELDPGELPATYLDNLLRVVDRADLEQLLGRLQLRGGAR
ncbi:MAG TPA: hypothetical protein VK932_01005 [Kofleriaceae bacterium]|nr:hypothetical protein [Kofleriaceae bacterium]